jgi:hypothetical protein
MSLCISIRRLATWTGTLAILGILSATIANASVIAEHSGNNSPSPGEGFTFVTGLGTAISTGVTNDNGTGLNAWKVNTDVGDPGSDVYGVHQRTLTPAELSSIAASSQKYFTVTSRIVSDGTAGAGPFDYGIRAWVGLGSTEIRMHLGINASNQFEVGFYGLGPVYATSGPNSYHTVSLRETNFDGIYDLYVDGIDTTYDYTPFVVSSNLLDFGDGSASPGHNGDVNWNLVQIAIPEPASIGTLAFAGCAVLLRRKRA